MNALMAFEIMIPVEALRTLVAPKWTIVLWRLLLPLAVVHLHLCSMATVEVRHHIGRYPADHLKLTAWIIDVAEHRAWIGIAALVMGPRM